MSPFYQLSPLSSEHPLFFPESAGLDWHCPQQKQNIWQSSSFGSEKGLQFLLTVCEQAEKEKEAEIGELSEKENFKRKENEMFAHTTLSLEAFFSRNSLEKKSFLNEEEDNWEDDPDSLLAYKSS